MDTILTYFNHMFLSLPSTEAVQRAKDELLAMAQDRYNDLKEEGKSENEAVGTVIEEFGNIEELASELGVEANAPQSQVEYLSETDAEQFLNTYSSADRFLGLGIFLLFLSPTLLIFLGCMNTGIRPVISEVVFACLGVPYLLVFLAAGLCLVIYSDFTRKPMKRLMNGNFCTDYATGTYIEEEYQKQQKFFVLHIMIGLSLLVIGVIPVIIMGVQFDSVPLAVRGIAVDLFMLLYGISFYSFIRAGMSQKRFKIIRRRGRFAPKKSRK